jgi:hypothetical protein
MPLSIPHHLEIVEILDWQWHSFGHDADWIPTGGRSSPASF